MMKWNEWTRSITKSNGLICTVRMDKLDWLLGLEILEENLKLITISNKSTVNIYIGKHSPILPTRDFSRLINTILKVNRLRISIDYYWFWFFG